MRTLSFSTMRCCNLKGRINRPLLALYLPFRDQSHSGGEEDFGKSTTIFAIVSIITMRQSALQAYTHACTHGRTRAYPLARRLITPGEIGSQGEFHRSI